MAINPAMEGYFSVKNAGKHGDVKLANALGNNYSQPRHHHADMGNNT
jgi:hypothetical protein